MDSTDFYRSFHTHPVNKLIHVFCIPLIVLTTINFLSKSSLQFRIPPHPYIPGTKQIMYKTIKKMSLLFLQIYILRIKDTRFLRLSFIF